MLAEATHEPGRWRLGVDVGGTFTDVVACSDLGHVVSLKVLSTPGNFERGVCDGVGQSIRAASIPTSLITQILHGTTVATNAVLERRGPRVALITTTGFRDVLEIGRLRTPAIYDLEWVKPAPLVPRERRLEVAERISSSGEILRCLDLASVEEAVSRAVAEGVQSFAVALLNSYVNGEHEDALAQWLTERFPHVEVTTSSDVIREPGEYERTSTAVLNAFLKPVVSTYLGRLATGLEAERVSAPIYVMQSSGGMMPATEAVELPVHLLESGPAAGVLAAAGIARQIHTKTAISFDMGGTTAKASLIEDGEVAFAAEFNVGSEVSASSRLLRGGGYAVRLPVVDLAEIGAGGGSVASVDEAGGLKVGPESAGAEPGPACYARGGERATVTDANLVLGYISPTGLIQAGVTPQAEAAVAAIDREIATPLGLSVIEAAQAIHTIASRQMARVLRAVTTERGRDITEQNLIVFGGSGGLHAASLATTVGISIIVVPPRAGVLSAVGLLWSPVALTAVEAIHLRVTEGAAQPMANLRDAMTDRLRERFAVTGIDTADVETTAIVDLRYAGQATELSLHLPDVARPLAMSTLAERFAADHLATYGHGGHGEVEMVRLRVTMTLPSEDVAVTHDDGGDGVVGFREAYFGHERAPVPVLTRHGLDAPTNGPLLVDDPDTTTVVPPGWTARLDDFDNIVLESS